MILFLLLSLLLWPEVLRFIFDSFTFTCVIILLCNLMINLCLVIFQIIFCQLIMYLIFCIQVHDQTQFRKFLYSLLKKNVMNLNFKIKILKKLYFKKVITQYLFKLFFTLLYKVVEIFSR